MHIIRFDDNYRIKSKLIVLDDLDELDAVPIKQYDGRKGGKKKKKRKLVAFLSSQILWFDFKQETLPRNFPLIPQILSPSNPTIKSFLPSNYL